MWCRISINLILSHAGMWFLPALFVERLSFSGLDTVVKAIDWLFALASFFCSIGLNVCLYTSTTVWIPVIWNQVAIWKCKTSNCFFSGSFLPRGLLKSPMDFWKNFSISVENKNDKLSLGLLQKLQYSDILTHWLLSVHNCDMISLDFLYVLISVLHVRHMGKKGCIFMLPTRNAVVQVGLDLLNIGRRRLVSPVLELHEIDILLSDFFPSGLKKKNGSCNP